MSSKIVRKLIEVTKLITSKAPNNSEIYPAQFVAGKNNGVGFAGETILSWWEIEGADRVLDEISDMLKQEHTFLASNHRTTIIKSIRQTFQEVCLDPQIFDRRMITRASGASLFESRLSSNPQEMGKYLYREIICSLKNKSQKKLVAYTAPRITGTSFSVASDGIHFIKKDDDKIWIELRALGYIVDELNPKEDHLKLPRLPSLLMDKDYQCFCVVETVGTDEECKIQANIKLRRFFSVILANSLPCMRTKVGEIPSSACVILPHQNQRMSPIRGSLGIFYPFYGDELQLSVEKIGLVKTWYRKRNSLEKADRDRLDKGAHFLNQAINLSGVDAFIYYFICLDALFGKSRAVYESIESRLPCLSEPNQWIEKFPKLYNLRNELIHGGSRLIEEWKDYNSYHRHFKTEPIQDIEKLAFACLSQAPDILKQYPVN
ncbi:HEPN domain-containing protein [Pseudidiomarina marina]|uniref:Uncharacterized protein n=1 Tax=Pseudidiomarina marina TaxID=502366 RepID=A0A432YCL8_9GAMM|nr:HEPN domain-containing protein [Pseudidiomarina marina]RUO58667.1 hypothetical protein CWI76_11120 [Pseudidiomarina marina]